MPKYQITVDCSEAGIFTAKCLSLPGCMGHGNTKTRAIENLAVAIRLFLEVEEGSGLPLIVTTPLVVKT